MNEHLKGNHHGRIRYDESFKQNALSLITEKKMSLKQVRETWRECGADFLRAGLKKTGLNPKAGNRGNIMSKNFTTLNLKSKI